jgi:hypothetical protein
MSHLFVSDTAHTTTPPIKLIVSAGSDASGGVWIHQLSRRHSQAPFKKVKGAIQLVLFHPIKPYLFVAVRSDHSRSDRLL